MSAQQVFAMCIDCWELHYGIADSNGVYTRDSGSSNHFDHSVHVFGRPIDYPTPVKNVLTKLHAGLPISEAEITMFSLAFAMEGVGPTNEVKPDPDAKVSGRIAPDVPREEEKDESLPPAMFEVES